MLHRRHLFFMLAKQVWQLQRVRFLDGFSNESAGNQTGEWVRGHSPSQGPSFLGSGPAISVKAGHILNQPLWGLGSMLGGGCGGTVNPLQAAPKKAGLLCTCRVDGPIKLYPKKTIVSRYFWGLFPQAINHPTHKRSAGGSWLAAVEL